MNSRLSSLSFLATALIVLPSAMQDPVGQGQPDPICAGCVPKVTFDLPDWAAYWDPGDLADIAVDIDWTITRDLKIPGSCVYLAGSCLIGSNCLALGQAVGSVDSPNLSATSWSLAAGTNECGTKAVDSVEITDYLGGNATTAKITAECSSCDLSN